MVQEFGKGADAGVAKAPQFSVREALEVPDKNFLTNHNFLTINVPGSSPGKRGQTSTLDLTIALPHLIDYIKASLADPDTGSAKALEVGFNFLSYNLLNQLLSALQEQCIANYLQASLSEGLVKAGVPEEVRTGFFQQIAQNSHQSLEILREHLWHRSSLGRDFADSNEESPYLTNCKVLCDPTLPSRLTEEFLLKPFISSVLGTKGEKSLLCFAAKDGEAILSVLGAGFRATLLESDPQYFVGLQHRIKKMEAAGASPQIDFARLDLNEAIFHLSSRHESYELVLLPELSQWRMRDLQTAHVNAIRNLVSSGGVIAIPSGISETEFTRSELKGGASGTFRDIRGYLTTNGFTSEVVRCELEVVAPASPTQEVRDAFIDVAFIANRRNIPISRSDIENNLSSYQREDGSYHLTLKMHFCKFTKETTEDAPGKLSKTESWPVGDFTQHGRVGETNQPETNNKATTFNTPVVVDGGISYLLVTAHNINPDLNLPLGSKIITPQVEVDGILSKETSEKIFKENQFNLIHQAPDIDSVHNLYAREAWKDYYHAQRERWELLLTLWPVQRELLELIVNKSAAAPNNAYHKTGDSIELSWFKVAAQHLWPVTNEDAKNLLNNTLALIEQASRSESPNDINIALARQLYITRDYLRRFDVPYDYRYGEYRRMKDLPDGALTAHQGLRGEIVSLDNRIKEASGKIVTGNHRLVQKIINQINREKTFKDERNARQILLGHEGLLRAIQLYNFKWCFSTYATNWIRQKIISDHSADQGLTDTDKVTNKIETTLEGKLGRKPTDEELIAELAETRGVYIKNVKRYLANKRNRTRLNRTRSLDAPIGRNNDNSFTELLVKPDSFKDSGADTTHLASLMAELVRALPTDYRDVLSLRSRTDLEGTDIGSTRRVPSSREYIRQLQSKGLDLVLSDSNPAYRRLVQYRESGEIPSEQERIEYVSELLNDTAIISSLCRAGIFTVRQLRRYSQKELELGDTHIRRLVACLGEKGKELARSVTPYFRNQISQQQLDWLPAPARAKILLGEMQKSEWQNEPLKSIYEHWISVLPVPQREIVTRFLPTSNYEGLSSARTGNGITKEDRVQLVQALAALGNSTCPTVGPVYLWIATGKCAAIKPQTLKLIADNLHHESKIAPQIALELISRGIYTMKQLKDVPVYRLKIIEGLSAAECERLKEISQRF